jgi:hypothetical protein
VPNRARFDLGRRGGVLEGVGDELGAHVIGDGPADDFLGVAVDDGGQVDEPLPGVDVGDVADELHPGAVGGEVPFDEVGHARGCLSVSGGGDAERAWLTGHQALVAHDLPHELGRTLGVFRGEIGVDAPIPVSAVGLLEEVLDPCYQGLPAGRGRRLRTGYPVVKA